MTANPPTSPSTGESTIGTTTLSKMLCHFTLAPAPAQPAASAAPPSPPISACDDDDGMPRHQVIMFQQIAPTSAPAHTATPAPPIGTEMMSPPMVCATRTPTNPPTRFITAARPKAMRGVSARVDTEVAMALAASWKPLV